ncbi:alpha-ketoacid dehydrogenase subunit beta [Candidatus Pacearchaeota archaeon]|nr:MAG: alpha-ketoacid dehydrogenase subunit beta [Candidatus Pacearchaeota archaeon]
MAELNMIEAIRSALRAEMKLDKKVVLLGEDIGVNGGVFRVTEGLQKEFGKERVIDTPLAESGIVGSAIGMAIAGLKPVAEIQFEGFIFPALDQLVNHAARIRKRSQGKFHCQLVVRCPIGGGIRALEHHSDSPETYLAHTPGLKVVMPSTPYDAKGLLASAIRDPDPVVFFEPKKIYRAIKEELPDEHYTIPLGKARVVKEGHDLTLITYGSLVLTAAQVAEDLREELDIELIDLRTLSPLDEETIISSVKKTGKAVVVHEAPRTLGFASEIIARINEKALYHLEAPVARVTSYDLPVPLAKYEDYFFPSKERITNAIRKVMKEARSNYGV